MRLSRLKRKKAVKRKKIFRFIIIMIQILLKNLRILSFKRLFENYEKNKQLFENEDENEDENYEENEDPFDNYDESYDDSDFNSPFVFDDQKYLLKNRHEYYIHDQEEYLEKTKYFHHKEYKKINKIKKKKQKESHESQKNQSSLNNQDSDHQTDKKDYDHNEEGTNEEEIQNLQEQEVTQTYGHLWVQCENCYGLNYKKYFFLTKLNVCEHCGYHLKMSSSERIELPIDQGTWNAMHENMNSTDPIEFDRNPTKIKDLPESEKLIPISGIPIIIPNINIPKGAVHQKNEHVCYCKSNCNYCKCRRHCNKKNCSHYYTEHSELQNDFTCPLPCNFDNNQNHSGCHCEFHQKKSPLPSQCHCECNQKNCKHSIIHCCICSCEGNENNGESNPQNGIDLGQNGAVVKDFKILNDLDTSSKPKNSDSFNEYSHMDTKSKDNKNPIAFDSTNNSNSRSDSEDAESEGGNSSEDAESEGGNSKSGYIDNISECEEKGYKDRIDSYQVDTGLTEAVQTGTGELNGIPVAMGVMDFQFMGGSMGSAVGEKITRLIEYATKNSLPLILVCASGGARMQEGILSLMQMAKISAALHKYQTNEELLYISILTSPTTGGVTASFGMLGDINISEPNADIGFAGKRVMEQTLNQTVPEDLQKAENFFQKGLLDLIVPRDHLKNLISELLKFHAKFF
uniref:acetyl-CoA carboxylase carboxyltransferase beta subunit n=1 Tax=Melocactus glaucescens TaxID=2775423 RepID=UPI00286A64B4|nr:acetyl-CoA carboxylase carboxyltransferase beta subunit [Melocactus glaucescens]YP_010926892.1 acetyl-CoA carboxylase carboxyltransferase beta subunit [Melocactus glaucescens]WKK45478.1 acetyl-CoA carboxylase carboxyltransferase beta subunit [Melocactus glaucescens]WKK45497.1 acetyl-CoA carboxylase carboxyltransferase beta subunit [Melocactus glaucescens]